MDGVPGQTHETAPAEDTSGERAFEADGVLPRQALQLAEQREWIHSEVFKIQPDSFQPASLDLHLGPTAWALRCSFLPDVSSTVTERAQELKLQEVDLRSGAMLERDRAYLVELREELRLPDELRGKANPKSSTGRLDVFTRLITDRNNRFDEIPAGYRGKLYLEIVPRSFAVHVREGLSLNQLRLMKGTARVDDEALLGVHDEFPLLYADKEPLKGSSLSVSDGLFLSLDLKQGPDRVVGYRAKRNSMPIDLAKIRHYRWTDFWDPVFPESGSRIVLEPETFYLLLSWEGVSIPPQLAAEMMAYDPTAGELRSHYAGFFDPGFGYDGRGDRHGSRAALEVRARDVPFMVEHRQPVCKLAFERMSEPPDRLYGSDLSSNYQGQSSMLSKHFSDQTAGIAQLGTDVGEQSKYAQRRGDLASRGPRGARMFLCQMLDPWNWRSCWSSRWSSSDPSAFLSWGNPLGKGDARVQELDQRRRRR